MRLLGCVVASAVLVSSHTANAQFADADDAAWFKKPFSIWQDHSVIMLGNLDYYMRYDTVSHRFDVVRHSAVAGLDIKNSCIIYETTDKSYIVQTEHDRHPVRLDGEDKLNLPLFWEMREAIKEMVKIGAQSPKNPAAFQSSEDVAAIFAGRTAANSGCFGPS